MRKLLIALFFVAACSKENGPPVSSTAPPARPKAALPSLPDAHVLLANSPEFSDYEFTNAGYSLPMQRSLINAPAKQVIADLKKAGWIKLDYSGNATLTAKARTDRRFIVRGNGFTDIVPLAKKELTAVTAVREDPEGAAADFEWRWLPNDVGKSFRSGAVKERFDAPQTATATLIHDGKSWTVLRIRPRA